MEEGEIATGYTTRRGNEKIKTGSQAEKEEQRGALLAVGGLWPRGGGCGRTVS